MRAGKYYPIPGIYFHLEFHKDVVSNHAVNILIISKKIVFTYNDDGYLISKHLINTHPVFIDNSPETALPLPSPENTTGRSALIRKRFLNLFPIKIRFLQPVSSIRLTSKESLMVRGSMIRSFTVPYSLSFPGLNQEGKILQDPRPVL